MRIVEWKCPSCKKLANGPENLVMKICGGCQVEMIRGYEYGNKIRERRKNS